MIESIRLKNFQAHKDTYISFTEGLNVIAGSSDVGKSSVIRALEWVRANRPLGLGYLRDGAEGPIHVQIRFSGGIVIDRIRDKATNYYSITSEGEEGGLVEFDSVSTDVPEEVTKVFNLESHNIKSQFAPMYLIQESAPAAARLVNSLVGFDGVGEAVVECERELAGVKSSLVVSEGEIEEAEGILERLDGIEAVGEGIEYAEEIERKCCQLAEEIDEITKMGGRVAKLKNKAKIGLEFFQESVEPLINSCSELVGEIEALRRELKGIIRDAEYTKNKRQAYYDSSLQSKGLAKEVKSFIEGLDVCPFCGGESIEKMKGGLMEMLIVVDSEGGGDGDV